MIEFRVLGPVEFWVSGERVDLGPARQRGLLAALLVEPERPTSIPALIDRVWGETPPEGVRSVVYTYVARLRRALTDATAGTDCPVTVSRDAVGYMLQTSPEHVDLWRFRQLLAEVRAADPDDPRRVEWLGRALRLWRGEALAGLNSDWAQRFRSTLQQLKHEALAEWADAALHAGRGATAIEELRRALLDEPLAEPLQVRLVRALYATGQGAEAMRQYERARRTIADELGTMPCAALQELHGMMLQGKPLGSSRKTELGLRSVRTAGAAPAEPKVPAQAGHRERPAAAETGPDLLPMDQADFSGRAAEINWLRDALTSNATHQPPTVVITGGAGVGKTSLVVRAAHALGQDFPDGRLYVDLRGRSDRPADPNDVLSRLLRALGLAPAEIPADLDARAELYRDRLSGRRVLIVLDDAANDRQIEPLLPSGRGCAIIITGRTLLGGPAGSRMRMLRELPQAQAVEMLARVAGEDRVMSEKEAAHQLARYCGGLPLALRAVANRLVSRPHWTVAQVLARIANEERRLDEMAYGSLDVRASLELSYNQLDATASRLFQHLGATIHPGTDLVAGPVIGLAPEEAEDALERLVDMHFLRVVGRDAAGRIHYRMHELHRIYARSVA